MARPLPFTLLLYVALAAPALAQTTLFDDGRWRVVGIDAGAEPLPIEVTQEGAPLGSFAELRFRPLGPPGGSPGDTLWLAAGGTLTPMQSGVPGATAVLGRAYECDTGLSAPLRFVSLDLPARSTSGGALEFTGLLSNLDSLASEKLTLKLVPPSANVVRLELDYRLVTLRDLCIDRTQAESTDEFRIVELRAAYVSASQHENDLVRYVKRRELDCDTFGDCDVDRISFCAPLRNEPGPVLDEPRRPATRRLELVHTSNLPAPTSSLTIELHAPGPSAVKPQGVVVQSVDPSVQNVSFWANWVDVRREKRAARTLGRFRFALEAEAPRDPGCDRTQD